MAVSIFSIKKAMENIKGQIHLTPVFYSNFLSKRTDSNIYLKAENMQKTGSFKIRGAYNTVKLSLNLYEQINGFITASTGNHGQAVAYSAALAGIPATVVLPKNASKAKIEAIKGYGANIVYNEPLGDRLALAQNIAENENLIYIPPFDHENIISGQGTIGLEILEQVWDVDVVLVPIGGGGLLSGISIAIKEIKPQVKVIGVEPLRSNCMYLSIRAGHVLSLDVIDTIADGIRTKRPGEITFSIAQKYVDDIMLVEDGEIIEAMYLLMERQKLIVEPAGAVSLAAALKGKFAGEKVVCILSGGNVELLQLAQMISNNAKNKSSPN
jgi:threonine ammonia-lyase medium form